MAKVILEHVYKTYRGDHGHDVNAVTDVSLSIDNEEFVVFVGPSGCGKSTTLRMIAGLEEISQGSIYIGGVRVNDVAPKDRDIAMVFQNYALYPHMSVYQNMAFGLQLRRQPKSEIDRRVNEAAQILGLSREMLERKPKALSGGQRQRVALGRAIVRKPAVFLFDEPLSNLDAAMRVQMRTEISKLHAQLAATMIYVTHDQVEAMTMGDRIVVMKNGIIQQVAEPLTLYHDPANMFVASFIGSPAINFFRGTIDIINGAVYFVRKSEGDARNEIKLRLSNVQARKLEPFRQKEIVFGIRPEHLRQPSSEIDADSGRIISAQVEVVEPLGPETFVYLKAGSSNFTARFPETRRDEVDAKMQVAVDIDKGLFFSVADTTPFLQSESGNLDIDSWRTACKRLA